MKTETLVVNLLKEKRLLAKSVQVSCDSIKFWEKRANKLFKKMDDEEEKYVFYNEEAVEASCEKSSGEMDSLMKRIRFENDLLDHLEEKIEKLEDKIVRFLAADAKKNKK